MSRSLTTLFLVLSTGLLGCDQQPPDLPLSDQWLSHHSATAGYRIQYPQGLAVDDHHGGEDTLLRRDGFPVVSISVANRQQAANRGLWAAHAPVSTASLAGRAAEQYRYTHCDAFVCMPTLSLVVPHRGGHFALEFRTTNLTLDAAQERLAASVSLAE